MEKEEMVITMHQGPWWKGAVLHISKVGLG
jgi:hypothetical protein